jgi:ribosomal-protein-serine acetyltransferase
MVRLPERIEIGGLLLRRWQVSDAEALHEAVVENADHLKPWMAWMADEPQAMEQRRAMIARWEKDWIDGGDVLLGVFVDGRVAGSCGLHRRQGPGVLEIGYWIHQSFVRRGLATTVAVLLTDAALTVPDITRVEIHHDKANTASAGVPRGLGYRLIGEHRDGPAAPSEMGIECVWRIEHADWSRSASATTAQSPPSSG